MKPGYMTTEFWLTLLAQVVPILVLTGVVSSADAQGVTDSTTHAVEGIGSTAVAVAALWKYIQSRADLKKTETVASLSLVQGDKPSSETTTKITIGDEK